MIAPLAAIPPLTLFDAQGGATTVAGGCTLVFFKVSCPTCQLTLPFLTRASKDEPLFVVSQDTPQLTGHFAVKFNAPLAYLYDRAADNYPASNALGLNYVPSMIRVGADGRVIEAVEGFDKAFLEDLGIEFQPSEKVPNFKPG
jgi:hypothetical protein